MGEGILMDTAGPHHTLTSLKQIYKFKQTYKNRDIYTYL